MNSRRDEKPDDAAAHLWVGHHALDFACQTALCIVSVRSNPAQLRIGFIDENEDFSERVEDPF